MGVSTDLRKVKPFVFKKLVFTLTKQRYENKSFVNTFLVSKKSPKGI